MTRTRQEIQAKAAGQSQAAARDIITKASNAIDILGDRNVSIFGDGNVVIKNLYVSKGNTPMKPTREMDTRGCNSVSQIHATVTRCRDGQALVVLDSEPFNGMEVRPHDLRRLAENMTALAEMANRLPMGGKHWKPTTVQIGRSGLTPVSHALAPVDYSLGKIDYTKKPGDGHEGE